MEGMKYKREVVLAKLKENRTKHEAAYNDAMEGFKEAYIKEVSQILKLAKEDKEYRLTLNQKKPTEHLREYDRVIAMMELSCQDEVQLETHEFTSYVMDNWNWSNEFRTVGMSYGKTKALWE